VEITNAQLILPDQIRRGNLTIRDGRIHKITFGKPRKTRGESIDLRGSMNLGEHGRTVRSCGKFVN